MFKFLLLASLLLLSATQTITTTVTTLPNVGGYQSYTDLSSPEFTSVLNFVYASNPSLSGYSPTTVQRQLVNGFNYQINLQNSAGCTAQVSVYAPFTGTPTINSVSQDPCAATSTTPTITISNTGPVVLTPTLITGGYNVLALPSGVDYESALAQALQQNNYDRSDLVLTEVQTVNGFNYRFTFRNSDGTLTQVVIYVPIGGIQAEANASTISPTSKIGRWNEVASASSISDVLNAIYKQYPQVKLYSFVGAESQVVAGFNYRVGLQNNTQGTIKYALFKVFFDLSGVYHVTQLAWIDETGYSVDQLNQSIKNSIQLHPEINGGTVVSTANIWPKEGLRFTFSQTNSKNYNVFIYTNKGKLLNLIYPA